MFYQRGCNANNQNKQGWLLKKNKPKVEPTSPVRTEVLQMKVLKQAQNPQWVFCSIPEQDMGKVPVIIPRRFTNKLVGKLIEVEAISDELGTTYRYVPDRSY